MAQSVRLPLRWSGALPAGDLAPLNCLYGGGEGLPVLTADELRSVQIPKRALWPSVRTGGTGGAEAGPTGAPWVNSNGWLIRVLRLRDAARPVLLDTKPAAAARPASHVLAVADAMAYGASWIVSHSPETWPQVQKALRFFVQHGEWRDWKPVAALAIISDFTGVNETSGSECLNLLTRRQVGFSLAAPGDLDALADVRAAVWVSELPVPMEKYLPWVRGGGTLIVLGDYSRAEGKGRVIGLEETWKDAYGAATGIHRALSRRNDVLRLWNAGSFNSFYRMEPGGHRGVAHLINYAVNLSSNDTSIWLARPWKKATLSTFDGQTLLKTRAANGGIEIPLPPLGVYAAIELEA